MASKANISTLKMFFTRLGGKDIPASFNWFDNFGFDSTLDGDRYINYTDPVFKHSLINVMNAFQKPRMFTVTNQMNNGRAASDIAIIETSDNDDANELKPTTTFWKRVFKLIEFIYENQTVYMGPAVSKPEDGSSAYTCYGDELLRSNDMAYTEFKGIYKPASLKCHNMSGSSRVYAIELVVTNTGLTVEERAEDDNISSNGVTMTIYFDPDEFILSGGKTIYKVYSYEDLTGDMDIDDTVTDKTIVGTGKTTTEFDAMIVNKITEITKNGKYKRYIRYCPNGGSNGLTFFIDKGYINPNTTIPTLNTEQNGLGEEINETNRAEYGYNKVFYIFTSLDESQSIDDEIIRDLIKEYIENTVIVGDEPGKISERLLRFPNLFSNIFVNIYPMYKNTINDDKNSNNVFGISNASLKSILNDAGNPNEYEIFYVGSSIHTGGDYRYSNIPLLAVEQDASGNSYRPVSSRFNDYRPIYSSTDSYYNTMNRDTIVFHELCILALSILYGFNNISEMNIGTNITIRGEDVTLIDETTNLQEIKPGYDQSTGEYRKHSIMFTFKGITYKFIDVRGD